MYRAPELHGGGAPTIQGDVYALGVLLYQVVCGDFAQPPVPGWKRRIADPLLRQDIAEAATSTRRNALRASRLWPSDSIRCPRAGRRHIDARRSSAPPPGPNKPLPGRACVGPGWVLALCSLSLALLATLWSAHRARQQRDREREHADSLAAMYGFVAQDLLGQSNPYLGVAGSGQVPQQTLLDAIGMAVPPDRSPLRPPAGDRRPASRIHCGLPEEPDALCGGGQRIRNSGEALPRGRRSALAGSPDRGIKAGLHSPGRHGPGLPAGGADDVYAAGGPAGADPPSER